MANLTPSILSDLISDRLVSNTPMAPANSREETSRWTRIMSRESGEALDGAVVGGILGGLFDKAGGNAELEESREKIIFECLRGRRHSVVGSVEHRC